MSNGVVSVIIPTFNRAYCIERAIDSAANQTHRAVEIIVVDDGSTDNTRDVIARRYASDPRVRYVYQDNQGVATARNHGIRLATGDYAAFLDSDDVWKPWKTELQLCCLHLVPEAGMVWSDMEAIDSQGALLSAKYLRTMYKAAYRWFTNENLFSGSRPINQACPVHGAPAHETRVFWGDIFSPMVMGNLVHTSTTLIRRERLEKVVGFNEDLKFSGEDYDFHLRTCREGPVAFLDLATIEYQVGRADQLTRPAYRIHMAHNFLKTITPILDRDRNRIDLPAPMLAHVQAEAHAWIGREHLELGQLRDTRAHLVQSLRYQAWQPRVWILLALAVFPSGFYRMVKSTFRFAKRSIGQ